MSEIDEYSPGSGRILKEDDTVINWADILILQTVRDRALDEGRRFRASHKLTLTDAVPVRWLRFDILSDIDLIFARQSAADGSYDYEVFAGSQISSPSGFTDQIPAYASNSKSGVPVLTPAVDLFGGVNATATASGVPNVTLTLRASGAGASSSISRTIADDLPRGFPATTAYARLTRVGTTDCTAVLEYEFDQF